MRKFFLVFIFLILVSCNTQKQYTDFDISYARSGGYAPIYENLIIKGNKLHYSLEGQGKNIKKDLKISDGEVKRILTVLEENKFNTIREDNKKLNDHITTIISIKVGKNIGAKSDASLIIPADTPRWDHINQAFTDLKKEKNLNN